MPNKWVNQKGIEIDVVEKLNVVDVTEYVNQQLSSSSTGASASMGVVA
jgi:hypothetical protein